jgi:filamentous hemagglutinin
MSRLACPLLWIVSALACLVACRPEAPAQPRPDFGRPHIDKVVGKVPVLQDAKVVDKGGKVLYEGPVDVNPTLDRVRQGMKVHEKDDGTTFHNAGHPLPKKADGYYLEFVHKMKDIPFPGPARLILGREGEVYFTGDHYHSFVRVNPSPAGGP